MKADISAGSVGSPDGYTTLVVRTLVGQHLLDSAVARAA
ncbi:Coenzyme F420 hydrogenase/dehydrogenase, beta subunit C-terminal domain [Methanosarcina sp. WH1]|nr:MULTISPECIES: Coenzyme F420 hydrogenase/dehydrogenase, beta subunit C-terminal domain [unclassified Methanosarcina]